jgi:hypothetical protein
MNEIDKVAELEKRITELKRKVNGTHFLLPVNYLLSAGFELLESSKPIRRVFERASFSWMHKCICNQGNHGIWYCYV